MQQGPEQYYSSPGASNNHNNTPHNTDRERNGQASHQMMNILSLHLLVRYAEHMCDKQGNELAC